MNSDSKTSFRTQAWEFWRRNHILVIHAPLMVAFLFGAYVFLKALDPHIGVEGFGDLFGYILDGVRVTLIIFTAFWIKRWAWFDLRSRTEYELFRLARAGDTMAFWIVAKDRLEWLAALAFATYWFTR